LMKGGALIVNTAHPQLIDAADLAWAIETKAIRVAQDGWGSGEAWDRLLQFGSDRFLAVPSMAFNTEDANLRASLRTAAGVCDVLDGGSSPDVNNPEFRAVRASR
jgi:phosphoglycerate dehydrogenase-like enzyme